MKRSKNSPLENKTKLEYNKEEKKKSLEEIQMNIENDIVKINEVFDKLANIFKPLYKMPSTNGSSTEETENSMKTKSNSEPQQKHNKIKERKSSFRKAQRNTKKIKNIVKTTKIYRIKRRKSINKNKNIKDFGWRIYIKVFNESLCLGPYIKKEIAEEIRNTFYKKIKKEEGLSPSNILEFYEKFKSFIKNKRYASIRMMRKRKYYRGTSRKV